MAVSFVHFPGLHKQTGQWAFTRGIRRPRVYFDPLVDLECGGRALMIHEATHVLCRDPLYGIILLFLCPPLYIWHRRRAEIRADREAFKAFGLGEFRAFVTMHRHPTSALGRWMYGNTVDDRIRRTVR